MFKCQTCHDPHKSTKYELGEFKGQDATCKTCHPNVQIKMAEMANLECRDCHMPRVTKSAIKITVETGAGPIGVGDIRCHIFSISDDPNYSIFSADGHSVVKDVEGKAHLEIGRVCLPCHASHDVAWAGQNAEAAHKGATAVASYRAPADVPREFALHQDYPNPFDPTTTIPFDLKESPVVKLTIYTLTGQEVATVTHERLLAGHGQVTFTADELSSAVYVYRLTAGDFTAVKKTTLLR